jgi:hypothetical protein
MEDLPVSTSIQRQLHLHCDYAVKLDQAAPLSDFEIIFHMFPCSTSRSRASHAALYTIFRSPS